MSEFIKSIKAFTEKAKGDMDQVVKKGSIDILNELIRMSPVGKPELWKGNAPVGYVGGRFRGNWQVSFNSPAQGVLDRVDPTGSMTLKEGMEKILQFSSGVGSIYFTNNLPYSVALEFGHSSQAPNGMVRITAINAQEFFNNAAKEGK